MYVDIAGEDFCPDTWGDLRCQFSPRPGLDLSVPGDVLV